MIHNALDGRPDIERSKRKWWNMVVATWDMWRCYLRLSHTTSKALQIGKLTNKM